MSISLFLFGSVTLRIPASHRLTVLNLCLSYGIPYRDFTWESDGSVTFSLPSYEGHRLRRLCRPYGITPEVCRRAGIPAVARFFCHRAGLFIGILLSVGLLILSGRFVWRVEVKGNERLTSAEIEELLSVCELGVGSYIPAIDTRKAENRVLMSSSRLSWISLYLEGTTLSVQVIEREEHTGEHLPPPASAPANLVAAHDGQIERIELFRGQVMVGCGQAVKAGELLVSGVYDSNAVGYRYTRAAGHIWARTEREYCIRMPLTYTEKVYSDPKPATHTLHFFNFSLNFFQSTGNLGDSCDIIKKETEFHTPAGLPLPLSVTSAFVRTYTEQPRTRTREEALALCYAELDRILGEALSGAELLGKEIATEMTDSEVILRVRITALEDIALQVPFEVVE